MRIRTAALLNYRKSKKGMVILVNFNPSVLRSDEKAVFELRSLYSSYGYSRYKMSKFEEYDLYVRNKEFLVSDRVITFTDTSGKLMALKPDVTLSIIRNSEDADGYVRKVYYNENVYRVSKGNGAFGEIMQTGLECIGDIDDYNIYEVLMLAAESLKRVSADYVLDVSHMGVVEYVLDSLNVSDDAREKLISCVGEKNVHEIRAVCEKEGADSNTLEKLVTTYGSAEKVCGLLRETVPDCACVAALEKMVSALEKNGYAGHVNIDFSVTGNVRYYNGFVFKGFINGIASGVLSGGQYDKLMKRMNRRSRAIGFAVYLDLLERFTDADDGYDVDTVILYGEGADLDALCGMVKMLTDSGRSVVAQRKLPEKLRYKQLLRLQERGVEILENNA